MASSASETSADLCILGSGIAGMLLAERALARGRRVLMIERGTALTAAERLTQRFARDPLPFNRSPLRLPHEAPPRGPRTRWDRDYLYLARLQPGRVHQHLLRQHAEVAPVTLRPAGVRRRRRATLADHLCRPRAVLPRSRAPAGDCRQLRTDALPRSIRVSAAAASAEPVRSRLPDALRDKAASLQVPTVRPSRPVGTRPACCGSEQVRPLPDRLEGHGAEHRVSRDPVEDRAALGPAGHDRFNAARRARRGGHGARRRRGSRIACTRGSSSSPATASTRACCCSARRTCRSCPSLGRYFMDHPIIQVGIYDAGVDARPGYGDSAQTGMLVPFFEQCLARPAGLDARRDPVRLALGGRAARSCATSSCATSSPRR